MNLDQLGLSVRLERRWPLQLLLGAAIVWAVLALLAVWPAAPLAVALAVLPPLCLAALTFALLPAAAREVPLETVEARLAAARAETEALLAALDTLNNALFSATEQAGVLTSSLATDTPGLAREAAALALTATSIDASGTAARATADALSASLPVIKAQVETIGQGLSVLGEDAGVQLRAVEAMLARVQAQNAEASSRADLAITALTAQVSRIEAASRDTTDAIAKRSYALDGAVDGVLLRASTAFADIDKRLTELLDRLDSGLEGAGGQLTRAGEEGVRTFTQRFDTLIGTSKALEGALAGHAAVAETIQARLTEGEAFAGRLAEPLAGLADHAETLAGRTGASLADAEAKLTRLAISTEQIRTASADLDAGESRLVHLAQTLDQQLAETRTGLAALQDAAAAAAGMGEDTGHRLATQAETILARVQAVDARLDAIETRFVTRERSTLARDAQRLMAGLSTQFGDLVQLLNLPVPEADWAAWLKGDRTALPASVRGLLHEDEQRQIARHFAHDPVFRAAALRFLDGFETLIARLLGDREGDALAATMLSADYGKLYVRVGEAAGRNAAGRNAAKD